MSSQDSVSLPVRCRSTSPLKPSFGSSLALCNQVAQSNLSPSFLATLTNSVALLQPISRSCCFGIRVRYSSNDFSFSNLQYCFDLTSHRYSPSSTNRASFSCSLVLSQLKISSILPNTNEARWRLS